jgi:integrase
VKHRKGYLYKRGNVWWLKLQIENRVIRRTLETSDKAEAERKASAIVAPVVRAGLDAYIHALQCESEDLQARESESIRLMPLAQWWDSYLASARRPDSSERTLQAYEQQARAFVSHCQASGIMITNQVTSAVAEDYFLRCLSTRHWNGGTFNKHLGFMKLLWKTLFEDVLPSPFAKIATRSHTVKSWRTLSEEEVENWAGAIRAGAGPGGVGAGAGPGAALADQLGRAIEIGAGSGLRLVDVCLLRAGAVDTVNACLCVLPAKTRRRSGRAAVVPLWGNLRALVCALVAASGGGYLLPVLAEEYLRNPGNVSRLLSGAARRAGLVGVGFACLRHTFASSARLRGVPEVVVQNILGHSSPAMSRHYIHVVPGDMRAAS